MSTIEGAELPQVGTVWVDSLHRKLEVTHVDPRCGLGRSIVGICSAHGRADVPYACDLPTFQHVWRKAVTPEEPKPVVADINTRQVMCPGCHLAFWMLNRLGMRDTVRWAQSEGPTRVCHATHSNSRGPDGLVTTLCMSYQSELRWLGAGRNRVAVYLAHPMSGNVVRNTANVHRWVRYLNEMDATRLSNLTGREYRVKPTITAPWLAGFVPDNSKKGGRDQAMAECRGLVAIFDELWLVGGRVSRGMAEEAGVARVVVDLTRLGYSPPGNNVRTAR